MRSDDKSEEERRLRGEFMEPSGEEKEKLS